MVFLNNCSIKWGVIEYFQDIKDDCDGVAFIEYRIDNLEDLDKLKSVDEMCVAHIPDPQDDDWLEIIENISRIDQVSIINTHARSEDLYLLCDSCGSRMVNTKSLNHFCDVCGNIFTTELVDRAIQNSTELLTQKINLAHNMLPSNKVISIENTYEPPQYFVDLFKGLPREVGFTFDVGHANIYHNLISEYIYMMRDRICHLHLHDNMGGSSERFHDTHARPGAGSVNWHLVARALNQIGFSGSATYECEPDAWWLAHWR